MKLAQVKLAAWKLAGWDGASITLTMYDRIAALSDAYGYAVDPALAGVDALPAAVVGRSRGRRYERRIGYAAYVYVVPVVVYSDLALGASAYDEQAELLESFIRAMDGDPTLGGRVEEAVVSEWGIPRANRDHKRATLSTEAVVTLIDVLAS